MSPTRAHLRRAVVLPGGVIVTTVNQGITRSWMDRCWTTTTEGVRGEGVAIHLTPWQRNRWGEIKPGRALVLARVRRPA